MNLQYLRGLAVAIVNVDEAVSRPWAVEAQTIDVVRVVDPPRASWPALGACGFLRKPSLLTWVADTRAAEAEMLAHLSAKGRQNIRRARRRMDASDLRTTVRQPIDALVLDAFLQLYESGLTVMRRGVPYASEQRAQVLADADRYVAICVHRKTTLVGACLCEESPSEDVLRVRFSAIDDEGRKLGLARILYLDAARVARDRGHRWVTLGNDPNLYGHVPEPGLFAFKVRMGFRAVPSQVFTPGQGADHADRLLTLRSLNDPSMIVAYEGDDSAAAPAPRLRAALFSRAEAIDVRPFDADFLTRTTVHHLG